jgi:hypothetical protein
VYSTENKIDTGAKLLYNGTIQNERGGGMGQTDSQFKAFIRLLLDALKEIEAEPDREKRSAKMKKVLDNLQKTLED